MAEVIEQLQQLGFSQYEAQAYVSLLGENPLNGYELAKVSGIPRPNIYAVLQKLEEHGAVMRLESLEGVRYLPVAPGELLMHLRQRYQGALESAAGALEQYHAPLALEHILNLRGYPALLDHAQTLIDHARHRLLLSIWPEEAMALAGAVDNAEERGVEITTLCLHGCAHPCPACRGTIFRYALAPANSERWLVLVPDDEELLAGEISAQGQALSVRTRQKMLVNLTASYIQNSIALATVLSNLGDRIDTVLDARTLAALDSLHPLQTQENWLDMMRQVINSGNTL